MCGIDVYIVWFSTWCCGPSKKIEMTHSAIEYNYFHRTFAKQLIKKIEMTPPAFENNYFHSTIANNQLNTNNVVFVMKFHF